MFPVLLVDFLHECAVERISGDDQQRDDHHDRTGKEGGRRNAIDRFKRLAFSLRDDTRPIDQPTGDQ